MTERREIIRLFRQLCRQPQRSFPKAGARLEAPCAQGVYVLRDPRRRVVHVGGTPRGRNGIYQRLYNHLYALSSFTDKYLQGQGKTLRDGYTFQCLEIEDARQRVLVEAFATAWLCPLHLGLGESKKADLT